MALNYKPILNERREIIRVDGAVPYWGPWEIVQKLDNYDDSYDGLIAGRKDVTSIVVKLGTRAPIVTKKPATVYYNCDTFKVIDITTETKERHDQCQEV